jgi:hypothetical protein
MLRLSAGGQTYIICDSHSSQISEQGDEDDQLGPNGFIDDYHRSNEIDLKMNAKSNTVLDVSLHALEDLSGSLDSQHDCAKTRGEEDDVGSGLRGFGCAFNSDTAIGFLQ